MEVQGGAESQIAVYLCQSQALNSDFWTPSLMLGVFSGLLNFCRGSRSDDRTLQTFRFSENKRVLISHNVKVAGRDTGSSETRETQVLAPVQQEGWMRKPASAGQHLSCTHTHPRLPDPFQDLYQCYRESAPAFNHLPLCQKLILKELKALVVY